MRGEVSVMVYCQVKQWCSLDEDHEECLVGTTVFTKAPEMKEPVLDSGVFEVSPTMDSIGALDQVMVI